MWGRKALHAGGLLSQDSMGFLASMFMDAIEGSAPERAIITHALLFSFCSPMLFFFLRMCTRCCVSIDDMGVCVHGS